MNGLPICTSVHHMCTSSTKAKDSIRASRTGAADGVSSHACVVLETEPESSIRAATTLNYWLISPATLYIVYIKI